MLIYLLRHGETAWNTERRYQGLADIPLSKRGRSLLETADIFPERIYVSPLRRAVETAAVCFPKAERVVISDLREMNFGIFEGRNSDEMVDDPAYRAWVEGGCIGRCPEGEDWMEFSKRTCAAFAQLMKGASYPLVIVAHGGTQMAILERYGRPARPRWNWLGKNGGGFLLKTDNLEKQGLYFVNEVYWGR